MMVMMDATCHDQRHDKNQEKTDPFFHFHISFLYKKMFYASTQDLPSPETIFPQGNASNPA